MIQTDITSVDPTGQEVVPDPNLRARVARAAELLRADLEPVETLPIESRWRIVHQPGSDPHVFLDLLTEGAGIRDWLFDPGEWTDDAHIRRLLRGSVTAFGQAMSTKHLSDAVKFIDTLKKPATPALVGV